MQMSVLRGGFHYYLRLKLLWKAWRLSPHICRFGYGGWIGLQAVEPACRGDRVLRTAAGGRSRPPTQRDGAGACHLAPVPSRRLALAEFARQRRAGERLNPAPLP